MKNHRKVYMTERDKRREEWAKYLKPTRKSFSKNSGVNKNLIEIINPPLISNIKDRGAGFSMAGSSINHTPTTRFLSILDIGDYVSFKKKGNKKKITKGFVFEAHFTDEQIFYSIKDENGSIHKRVSIDDIRI